ncbi:hypothetical protein SDC9_46860 [bioreactor metagenome]|uniref:DUF1320 domain-containing protein n=1 Tax=bioreactor metagenome TaxID=1076179 RepID=A0A644WA58_9ZZZZ
MSFLTDDDYEAGIRTEFLTAITRNNPAIRASAENAAISEMRSYLNNRYDADAIFSATGDNRSQIIVMLCRDIALYHMHAVVNPNVVPDIRKDRYDEAIDWLKQVSRLKINPDLPLLSTDTKNYIRYGSNTKHDNYF